MRNETFLIITVLILFLIGTGLLIIRDIKYQQCLEIQSQEAKDAVYNVLEGPEGSYYVKEIGSFISHFNKGQWIISNKKRGY